VPVDLTRDNAFYYCPFSVLSLSLSLCISESPLAAGSVNKVQPIQLTLTLPGIDSTIQPTGQPTGQPTTQPPNQPANRSVCPPPGGRTCAACLPAPDPASNHPANQTSDAQCCTDGSTTPTCHDNKTIEHDGQTLFPTFMTWATHPAGPWSDPVMVQ